MELKLSSVTLHSKINTDIDLNCIVEINSSNSSNSFNISYHSSKKNNNKGNFYNSLIFRVSYKDSPNISCNIFSNGSIQVSGLKSLNTSNEIIHYIYEILMNYFSEALKDPKCTCGETKICNIKYYLKLGKPINQISLKNRINDVYSKEGWQIATFNSDNFYGVKAQYSLDKLIFFRTGTVCINTKNPDNLEKILEEVKKLF